MHGLLCNAEEPIVAVKMESPTDGRRDLFLSQVHFIGVGVAFTPLV